MGKLPLDCLGEIDPLLHLDFCLVLVFVLVPLLCSTVSPALLHPSFVVSIDLFFFDILLFGIREWHRLEGAQRREMC